MTERRVPQQDQFPRVLRVVDFTVYDGDEGRPVGTIDEATAVTSEAADRAGFHYPVIDVDFPVEAIPSSTPGHTHLYIGVPMPWETFIKLLQAMADALVVEQGYVDASVRRAAAHLRLPWIRKGSEPAATAGCTCDQLAHPCELHDCQGGAEEATP